MVYALQDLFRTARHDTIALTARSAGDLKHISFMQPGRSGNLCLNAIDFYIFLNIISGHWFFTSGRGQWWPTRETSGPFLAFE